MSNWVMPDRYQIGKNQWGRWTVREKLPNGGWGEHHVYFDTRRSLLRYIKRYDRIVEKHKQEKIAWEEGRVTLGMGKTYEE